MGSSATTRLQQSSEVGLGLVGGGTAQKRGRLVDRSLLPARRCWHLMHPTKQTLWLASESLHFPCSHIIFMAMPSAASRGGVQHVEGTETPGATTLGQVLLSRGLPKSKEFQALDIQAMDIQCLMPRSWRTAQHTLFTIRITLACHMVTPRHVCLTMPMRAGETQESTTATCMATSRRW